MNDETQDSHDISGKSGLEKVPQIIRHGKEKTFWIVLNVETDEEAKIAAALFLQFDRFVGNHDPTAIGQHMLVWRPNRSVANGRFGLGKVDDTYPPHGTYPPDEPE